MNPVDAHPQDLAMYYNNTFMKSKKHRGIVSVVSINDEANAFAIYRKQGKDGELYEEQRVPISDLTCWWPESGSYNINGCGVYVGRRARRNMKKSAYDHYYVQWGAIGVRPDALLWHLAAGPNWLTIAAATEILNSKVMKSVAIARDLILQRAEVKGETILKVIFRGQVAGTLQRDQFIPCSPGDMVAKLAEFSLLQEGVQCI